MFGDVKVNKTSDVLAKCRIGLYTVAWLHLVILASVMLTIDFRSSSNPEVWIYQDIKYKLITCWFNLLSLVYFPASVYCEWRQLKSQEDQYHVRILNQMRNLIFTSILLPTTVFSDLLFWRLWNKDRELVAPASVDELAPFWTQHCMHTVTLVGVVLDLIMCPRKKPKNTTLGLSVLFLFLGLYVSVCTHALWQEQYLYPVLKLLSIPKLCILAIYMFTEHYFYFSLQWLVIQLIWGENNDNGNIRKYRLNNIPCRDLALNKLLPVIRLTKSAANIQS